MATRYWFKPKRYGFGATPVTWEGWAFTVIVVLLILGMTWYLVGTAGPSSAAAMAVWALMSGLVVAGSIALSAAKTEGAWRWRWGDPK